MDSLELLPYAVILNVILIKSLLNLNNLVSGSFNVSLAM